VISRPTTPQLLEAVCAELEARVAPAVTEPAVRVVIDMAVAVLRGAAVRSANELAWMRKEADDIEELARRLVAELPGATALAAALDAYAGAKSESRYLADALEDYHRASEVLSCACEAVYADGDPARKQAVSTLFDQRMAHEKVVIGEFVAAGRT